jgi:hypothetical protein
MINLTTEQKQLLCKCVIDQIEKSVQDSYTCQKCEEILTIIKKDLNTQRPDLPT